MTTTRRDALAAALLATAPAVGSAAAQDAPPSPTRGRERIAFLLYPEFTALDLFGPHHMLSGLMPSRLDLVAATRAPVRTDMGVDVLPTATFDEIADGLDVLCVPGGTNGTLAAMRDPGTLDFLRRHGASAKWVTSVCTGSLVLGAAGLLRGYRATGHWAIHDLLGHLGAIPTEGRVVEDRNRMTGGGVTAGIDFGLTLLARFRDTPTAQAMQLFAEYDPQPPLDAGSPAKAPPAVLATARRISAPFIRNAEAAAREAGARL